MPRVTHASKTNPAAWGTLSLIALTEVKESLPNLVSGHEKKNSNE